MNDKQILPVKGHSAHDSILEALNPEQRSAVEHFGRPLLVLAGAGSGKTKVLTHKIAHLVKRRDINPSRILAITFTKKAAQEMSERAENLLGIRPRWVSTFHSFAARLLREDVGNLNRGFSNCFAIYDEHDSLKVIKELLKRANMKSSYEGEVRELISRAKQEYRENIYEYIAKLPYPASAFVELVKEYHDELQRSNALDYDDLLYFAVDLMNRFPDVRKKWQERFRFVLVDEYQDTNRIQDSLVWLVSGDKTGIMVVGDPQQCIYTWRGSRPDNVLSFVERYGADEIHLDRNYRSTQKILDVANKVISKADARWQGRILNLWSEAPEGEDVEAEIYANGFEEASHITEKISSLVRNGYKYSDIALLMRMSFLSRGFEKEFMANGIPFEVVRGLAFYERAEVRDLLAYLRFLSNPSDRASFERIINIPKRGIGKKAIGIIRGSFKDSWIQALCDTRFPPRLQTRVEAFVSLALKYRDLADSQPYNALMGLIKDMEYEEYLREKYWEDYEDRLQNISELANVLRELEVQGKTLTEFTEDLLLSTDQDAIGFDDKVKLMTVHAAKGLEFPVVFLVGLEEEIFPAAKALQNPKALEEERRLCYVAVSRAKERLFLSAASERMRFGSYVYLDTSRFIEELSDNHGGTTRYASGKRI